MRLIAIALWIGCLLSSLGVVHAEHRERKYVLAQEEAVQHRDELEVDWARLQLEEASLASHGRIDGLARARLQMSAPAHDCVVTVLR